MNVNAGARGCMTTSCSMTGVSFSELYSRIADRKVIPENVMGTMLSNVVSTLYACTDVNTAMQLKSFKDLQPKLGNGDRRSTGSMATSIICHRGLVFIPKRHLGGVVGRSNVAQLMANSRVIPSGRRGPKKGRDKNNNGSNSRNRGPLKWASEILSEGRAVPREELRSGSPLFVCVAYFTVRTRTSTSTGT